MKRDTAIEVIMARLGNRKGLEETAIREMQLAQDRLLTAGELPWFLETTDAPVTVAESNTIALPALYQRTTEDGLWIIDSDGNNNKVEKIDYPALQQLWAGNASSTLSDRYALWGTTIVLFPTPNAVFTLTHYFYSKGAILTTNIENLWLQHAPDLLIAETGIVMAQFTRDETAVNLFGLQRTDAQKRLITDTVAREEAGRTQRMGG